MHGISLAALLGAATWLIRDVREQDSTDSPEAKEPAAAPVDMDEADREVRPYPLEFYWPPGPLYQ